MSQSSVDDFCFPTGATGDFRHTVDTSNAPIKQITEAPFADFYAQRLRLSDEPVAKRLSAAAIEGWQENVEEPRVAASAHDTIFSAKASTPTSAETPSVSDPAYIFEAPKKEEEEESSRLLDQDSFSTELKSSADTRTGQEFPAYSQPEQAREAEASTVAGLKWRTSDLNSLGK